MMMMTMMMMMMMTVMVMVTTTIKCRSSTEKVKASRCAHLLSTILAVRLCVRVVPTIFRPHKRRSRIGWSTISIYGTASLDPDKFVHVTAGDEPLGRSGHRHQGSRDEGMDKVAKAASRVFRRQFKSNLAVFVPTYSLPSATRQVCLKSLSAASTPVGGSSDGSRGRGCESPWQQMCWTQLLWLVGPDYWVMSLTPISSPRKVYFRVQPKGEEGLLSLTLHVVSGVILHFGIFPRACYALFNHTTM